MANPKYATLTANTVATVTLDKDYDVVEVVVAVADASSNAVYYTSDGSTPGVATDGSQYVAGSAGSFLQTYVTTDGATVVKLKSAGTPTVQVRGLREIGGGS